MKYNFREGNLGKDFAKEKYQEVTRLIENRTSFTTLGITGVGVTYFLRYLATSNLGYFVYIDAYGLPELSKSEFCKALLSELGGKNKQNEQEALDEIRIQISKLTKKHKKVVLILNRFDQLKKEFDNNFLYNIRTLRYIDPEKVILIFTSTKPWHEIAPNAIGDSNLSFFSKYLYFPPFKSSDQKKLILINPSLIGIDQKYIQKALQLSGGHNQLFQLLLKTEKKENPLADHFIKLQLKEIYESLLYRQRKLVQKIALGKDVYQVDEFLINTGMVYKDKDGYGLFSPLFAKYIQTHAPLHFPAKEARLFSLLKKNLDTVVIKDKIFETVWPDNSQEATEWALNALVYRLRKNPSFSSSSYTIENHKKIGYILHKD